ncbi:arylesterase [Novosphingobium sp.]|uniref:arylesterase n=1 Tax=Novosphingobium sp. TaxID=1874826 RepID=UPI0025EE6522|nr:arylesterase [Novosphingobium sp.]MCC6925160.1 arylesterase [Novosphingobium sp.]
MKWKRLALVATPLLLAGCQQESTAPTAAPASGAATSAPAADEQLILALGDSLFAGYGLEPGQSYPAHLETALKAKGIKVRIVNAGVSGDTTAGGLQRIDFVLKGMPKKPVLAVISLGGNDMLRGLSPAETRKNLDAILTKFKAAGVPVLLLGMLAAPNLGADYAGQFNPIYPALAKQHGASLVPFFLQPLLDKPQLIQADHIHPTLAGIDVLVADTVDEVAGALPKPKG